MLNFFFIILSLLFYGKEEGNPDTIRLVNPSFEGKPQDATVPIGWIPCGENSTPDILPGIWGVYNEPSDGNSYLGLIAREDGTWEKIAQALRRPFKADVCYEFSVDLSRASSYDGYNIPVKLQIWASGKPCGREQLLAETSVIRHNNWKTYHFEFTPRKDFKYILIEARFANGIYFAYKGNLLIDNCSPFRPCQRAFIDNIDVETHLLDL
ncbi:MAG: carbohydrate binding domain-containing protein [Saprospiraceae bacterium]